MNAEKSQCLELALNRIPSDLEHAIERSDLLNDLAMELREFEQWDRMLALAAEAHELSTRAGYTRGIARSLTVRSFVEYIRADYATAVKDCLEALSLSGDDETSESWARAVLALVQWSLGNFDEAIRHGTYALEVFKRRGDVVSEAFAHTARGGIMQSLGRYEESLQAQTESLELFRKSADKVGEARALAGLATTLNTLGRREEALQHALLSIAIARTTGHSLSISRALTDLGDIYAGSGQMDKALECHNEALEIRRREGYRQAETTNLLSMSRIYSRQGDHERAIETLKQGLAIAEEIGALPKARDCHHGLMSEYDTIGQFEQALHHSRAYIEVRARISTDQALIRQQAIELESRLIWAQKDAEIQRLRNVELKHTLDELRATQAELVNSEKLAALGSLVAAVAHEMNTPLGVIRSASDMTLRVAAKLEASESSNMGSQLRANAQLVTEAAERIASVIRRLKSFAGIDQAPYSQASIPELVENTIVLLEPEYRGRIDVRRQYAECPPLYCYGADLGQVMVNLLRNAFEAIDGNGSIEVRTDADDTWVSVAVADTGRGIPNEDLPHIFDAGFNNRERRIKASLSLFASASIVRRHGGQIRVESCMGRGSTFTILLPRTLERAEQARAV